MATKVLEELNLVPVLVALTFVAGVVDAVSYFCLGRVFTANMTGNVVFIGFAVGGAAGLSIARSVTALLAFVGGGIAAGRLSRSADSGSIPLWIRTAFGTESLLLLVAAGVSFTLPGPASESTGRLYAMIVLIGIAMGLRSVTVRSLAIPDFTTMVLTQTIAGLAADSPLAGGHGTAWLRRLASVITMFMGALVGVFLMRRSPALALFVCGFISLACAVVVHTRLSAPAKNVVTA